MNKKLKYLAAIPFFGTCFLLMYLFFMCIKERISKSNFFKTFLLCGVVSGFCVAIVAVVFNLIGEKNVDFDLNHLGLVLTIVIAGYLMNAFTFVYVDKKWEQIIECYAQEGSFLETNKKRILVGSLIVAVVVTIIVLVLIFGSKVDDANR